jgi:ADP-L-glycero-D-manno-heptose 6-epimerase
MKYLITGYKGFIGSNLLKYLSDDVVVKIEKDWIGDLESVVKSIDIIFHIGAIADTELQDSTEMLKYNYVFSKELFDLAQKYKKKVIYSSSAACYGDGDGIPNNIYGWSKLLAEQYGVVKCDEFVALRYFNVYGPGENHKGKMSSVALQSWNGEINKLFPKKPKRDFVYIDDIISANIHAINSPKGVYEVGSGEARTFENVLDNMELSYGYHSEDKIPEWYQFYTKSDKSKWLSGWKPKYNLESGIKEYKEYLLGKWKEENE